MARKRAFLTVELSDPMDAVLRELEAGLGTRRLAVESAIWLAHHLGPAWLWIATQAVSRIEKGGPVESADQRTHRLARELAFAVGVSRQANPNTEAPDLAELGRWMIDYVCGPDPEAPLQAPAARPPVDNPKGNR